MESSTTLQKKNRFLGKRSAFKTTITVITWGFILSLALYYVFQNALRYLSFDQAVYQRHWSHAGWLFLHIMGGILALLLGPFQFWSGLRSKYVRLHRWIGRVYLSSIGVSAVAAIYTLLLPERSFGFHIGIAGLATAWLITASLAYFAIRRRHIEQHKEWMIRSYVVTFGFVTFRLLLDTLNVLEVSTFQERVSAVSWMCWAIPLLITEAFLQGRKIFKKPKVYRSA